MKKREIEIQTINYLKRKKILKEGTLKPLEDFFVSFNSETNIDAEIKLDCSFKGVASEKTYFLKISVLKEPLKLQTNEEPQEGGLTFEVEDVYNSVGELMPLDKQQEIINLTYNPTIEKEIYNLIEKYELYEK